MLKRAKELFICVVVLVLITAKGIGQDDKSLGKALGYLMGEKAGELKPKLEHTLTYTEKTVSVLGYGTGLATPERLYHAPWEVKIKSADFKSDEKNKILVVLSDNSTVLIEIIPTGINNFEIYDHPSVPNINMPNPVKIAGDAVYILAGGKVYASWDTTKTWSIDSINIGKLTTTDISIDTNYYGWISTNQGVFYQHPDSTIWRKAAPLPGSFQNINTLFVDRRNRIFVGRPGEVYYSTDRGSSWNDVSDGSIESIVSFGDDAFGNVYAVGQGSHAYRLSNLTLPWISNGDSIAAKAYLPSNAKIINTIRGDTVLYAATIYGIFQSTDFGVNWVHSPFVMQLPAHNFYAPVVKGGNYYFVSNSLGIFRVAAGDTIWEKVFPKQGFIWGVNALTSDSGGNVYGNLPIKTGPSTSLFYTVKSTDHGDTWIPDTSGFKALGINGGTQTFDHFVTKQGEQFLGGSGILYSKKPGQNWMRDTAGIGMQSGEYIADVSLNNKKGITYLARRAGGFPTYSLVIYQRALGDSIWQVVNTNVLAATEGRLISDQEGNIVVRTIGFPYKIWRYNGSTWTEVPLPSALGGGSFPQVLTVDKNGTLWGVFFANRNRGVYFTTNSGTTWNYAGLDSVGIKFLNAVDDSPTGLNKGSALASPTVYAVTFIDGVYGFSTDTTTTSIQDSKSQIAKSFELYQNYPNPFNPTTTIKFQIPLNSPLQRGNATQSQGGFVTLKVYDILGREVATLVNEERKAGLHSVQFDASRLSTGVYIYTLRAGSYIASKKLLLMK